MADDLLFKQADAAYQNGYLEKAFNLFAKAAENGDTSAMGRLAVMYGDGEGVDYDFDKSVYWDMKAIDAGNIMSLSNLAITYRTCGNIKKAKDWFEKAIDAGDDDAALELAKLYMVSEKEIKTVKKLLNMVINSKNVCESSTEEARTLLSEIPASRGL